jgi:hypothetical protein
MEHRYTEQVSETMRIDEPHGERNPREPAEPREIRPEDATPDEGVERPEPDEPDPGHVVEEKQQGD